MRLENCETIDVDISTSSNYFVKLTVFPQFSIAQEFGSKKTLLFEATKNSIDKNR